MPYHSTVTNGNLSLDARRGMRMAAWGLGLGCLAFFSVLTGKRTAYFLTYAALLLTVGSWFWTWFAARSLSVEEGRPPGSLYAGEAFQVSLKVRNTGRLRVPWVESFEYVPGGAGVSRVWALGSNEETQWTTAVTCPQRGVFEFPGTQLRTGDPFGFFSATIFSPSRGRVEVFPKQVDVGWAFPNARVGRKRRVLQRPGATPPDASGVREYDPADSFKLIHWPSTAKMGRHMCKAFEKPQDVEVEVVVDLDGLGYAGNAGEEAISVAASLLREYGRRQRLASLSFSGRSCVGVPTGKGERHLRRVMSALAAAELEPGEPLSESLARHGRQEWAVPTVLVTGRSSQDWGGWLSRMPLGSAVLFPEAGRWGRAMAGTKGRNAA